MKRRDGDVESICVVRCPLPRASIAERLVLSNLHALILAKHREFVRCPKARVKIPPAQGSPALVSERGFEQTTIRTDGPSSPLLVLTNRNTSFRNPVAEITTDAAFFSCIGRGPDADRPRRGEVPSKTGRSPLRVDVLLPQVCVGVTTVQTIRHDSSWVASRQRNQAPLLAWGPGY